MSRPDGAQASLTMARSSLALVAIALVALVQPGLSAPKPDSPAKPDFSQLLKEIQTSIDKSVADAKKNLNLPENPDGAAVVKVIREQSNKAEKAFQDIKVKLEESVKKNPELSGVIDNLKQKVDEASNKLKKENPEVAANAQKVADALKSGYDSVAKEIERVNAEVNKKGGLRDDLDNLLKNIIDRGIAASKELQKKVEEAIKSVQKS